MHAYVIYCTLTYNYFITLNKACIITQIDAIITITINNLELVPLLVLIITYVSALQISHKPICPSQGGEIPNN